MVQRAIGHNPEENVAHFLRVQWEVVLSVDDDSGGHGREGHGREQIGLHPPKTRINVVADTNP